jgi:hypothetical protein
MADSEEPHPLEQLKRQHVQQSTAMVWRQAVTM